jgi:hypothetical protein
MTRYIATDAQHPFAQNIAAISNDGRKAATLGPVLHRLFPWGAIASVPPP